MSIPPALPESPAGSPESEVDLYDTTQMQSKTISTKKWISEFDPTPSSNTPPPPVNSAAELYDFQDRVTEMVFISTIISKIIHLLLVIRFEYF